MSRTFREWNPDQSWLLLPAPPDWLPDRHLVYFLLDESELLDLSPIMEKYDSEKDGNLLPPDDEPEPAGIRSAGGFLSARGATGENSFRGSKKAVYHEMSRLPSFPAII